MATLPKHFGDLSLGSSSGRALRKYWRDLEEHARRDIVFKRTDDPGLFDRVNAKAPYSFEVTFVGASIRSSAEDGDTHDSEAEDEVYCRCKIYETPSACTTTDAKKVSARVVKWNQTRHIDGVMADNRLIFTVCRGENELGSTTLYALEAVKGFTGDLRLRGAKGQHTGTLTVKAKAEPKAAAAPKGSAKGKAKAEPKAQAAPQKEAAAEPKAKGKAKAKADAKAEPAPKAASEKPAGSAKAGAKAKAGAASPPAAPAPAPEPSAKATAKGKAKSKAKAQEAKEEPKKDSLELAPNVQLDDGSGPAWEVSTGMNKRQQKRKDKQDDQKEAPANNSGKNSQGAAGQSAPTQKQQYRAPAAAPKTALEAAQAEVERILNMKAPPPEVVETEPTGPTATAVVNVPEKRVGIVIGPRGSKIKLLQEKTGVTRIDTSGELFTITGPPDSVAQCEAAIKEMVEKGFCALMYDNFAESFLNVHPSSFPDIIGKQGAVLRKIKDELNVEVSIPEVPKGSPPGKKFKVTLAGSAEAVEKAKNAINDIVMYSHSDLTHPGQVHEELDIEPWAYRFIIGKAGSEMKHIQHNWSVRVNIPRENSANEKVLIVGERDNVDRAKAYIEKIVWNAENQAKGRDKEDTEANADPIGGDEGADEEWMKSYLYKR